MYKGESNYEEIKQTYKTKRWNEIFSDKTLQHSSYHFFLTNIIKNLSKGYGSLLPFQKEAVKEVLAGLNDLLVSDHFQP